MGGLIFWSSYYIDYTYTAWLLKKTVIEGKAMDDCLDFPEKYWRRIPKCRDFEIDRERKPSNEESLDEEVG